MNKLIQAVIEEKALDVLEALRQKYEINCIDEQGKTALHWSCISGNFPITLILIEKGADVNKVDKNNHTALLDASYHPVLEIMRLLIENGANPNIFNVDGQTPLMAATKSGAVDASRLLINSGAEINIKGYGGNTPMHWSMTEGDYPSIVNLLIEHGANLGIRNDIEKTALDMARLLSRDKSLKILEKATSDKKA